MDFDPSITPMGVVFVSWIRNHLERDHYPIWDTSVSQTDSIKESRPQIDAVVESKDHHPLIVACPCSQRDAATLAVHSQNTQSPR